jgi:hypothetical protein
MDRKKLMVDVPVPRSFIVLHGEHKVLHHHAHTHPQRDHVDPGEHPRRVQPEVRQQPHPEHEQGAPGDDEDLVATDARDEAAAHYRRHEEAPHEGQKEQARDCGGGAGDQLHVLGKEDDGAEEGHGHEEGRGVGDAEDAVAEQAERQDRLAGPTLLPPCEADE